jgi:hypothetical protein
MLMQAQGIFKWKFLMSCLIMTFLVLDLLSLANWRTAMTPGHAGSLAASFGPAAHGRRVILAMEARSPLAMAGARIGDGVSFDRGSDAYRLLDKDETVALTLFTATGHRQLTLPLVEDRERSGANAAAFLSLGLSSLFALALSAILVMRRSDSIPLQALAYGLLGDSLELILYLPGGMLQDGFVYYLRPVLITPCVLGILYFALSFPEERPLLRQRRFRIAFWTICIFVVLGVSTTLVDRLSGLPLTITTFMRQVLSLVLMACYGLTVLGLFCSWRASDGAARHRMAWIGACLSVPVLTFFLNIVGYSLQLISTAFLEIFSPLATTVAYIGLGYALLRHRLFNFSFAVNRTLVFTVTSLLLFLAFWLIEQVVHKLVHFDAVENNAMLGGAIAFGLFFAFNRLHHRVDHWIEHLFFREWRARESGLRAFVAKAAHYKEKDALIAAFGAAMDRFSSDAGNAIYLAGTGSRFERVHDSLSGTPAVLNVDDDIAVSLRAGQQGVVLTEWTPTRQAQLALAMMQGGELKGIILLGMRPDAQGYRPDEHAVLEFAAARISLDLSRLEAAELAEQLQQAKRHQEVQNQEQHRLLQEIDSIKQERATLMLALSKVGASA